MNIRDGNYRPYRTPLFEISPRRTVCTDRYLDEITLENLFATFVGVFCIHNIQHMYG